MNELHGISDAEADVFLTVREAICGGICGKGRHCQNMACLEYMLKLAGEIISQNVVRNNTTNCRE